MVGMAAADVFSALANPVRRTLLEALRDGPRAAGDLAGAFELSRPAVSEHLAVLRGAGLVREEPRGGTATTTWKQPHWPRRSSGCIPSNATGGPGWAR